MVGFRVHDDANLYVVDGDPDENLYVLDGDSLVVPRWYCFASGSRCVVYERGSIGLPVDDGKSPDDNRCQSSL